MKKALLKSSLLLLTLVTISSCSKSDDNGSPSPSPDSRNVKYEVTGNAIGSYDATYITGSGTGANEIPTNLPWSKNIVVEASVTAVSLNTAVTGATPGTNITAKIYVGNVVKKEQAATVQTNGTAIVSGLTYTLN